MPGLMLRDSEAMEVECVARVFGEYRSAVIAVNAENDEDVKVSNGA